MKILHVITSLKIGGAEKLLVDLAEELKKQNYDQKIIYFYIGPNKQKLDNLGIDAIQIKGLFFKYDPIFLLRLFLAIKNQKPDIVHSWLWSSNFLSALFCRILKIKQVSAIHSVFNKTGKAENSFFKTLLDRLMLNLSGKVILVSCDMKKQFLSFYSSNLIKSKCIVIQNGIKLVAATIHKKEDKNFIIGSVGRFIPLKNHEFLINLMSKIIKEMPNVKLWLIGYGPLEKHLKNKVLKLGLENYVVFIKSDNPQKYYRHMNCFALPSDQEGLSMALLEAMAYGVVPIVASKTKKHDVVCDSKNGFVSDLSLENFYECVKILYHDQNIQNEISFNASFDISNKFNLNLMVKKYINVYNNL